MEWYFWILVAVAVVTALQQLSGILRSVQGTQAMMKRLLAEQGIEWDSASEPSAKVKDLARTHGAELAAIKAYREQTGLGFKESKVAIERLSRSPHGDAP